MKLNNNIFYFLYIFFLSLSFWLPNQVLSKEKLSAEETPFGFIKVEFKEKTFSNLSITDAKTHEVVRKNVFTWQKQQIPVGIYSLELDIAGFKIKKDKVKVLQNQTTVVNVQKFGFIKIEATDGEYYRYDIFEAKSNKLIKRDIISINKQIVPAGTYNLVFNIGGTKLTKQDIVVPKNEVTTVSLNQIGHIIVKSYDNLFHKYKLLNISNKQITRDNLWTNYKHQTVAGVYDVEVNVNGIITTLKNIEIKANETNIVKLKGFGSVEIKFPGNKFNRYDAYDAATNNLIRKNILMKDKQPLPEGVFNLVFNIGGLKLHKKDITVKAKENTLVEINNFGELKTNCPHKGFFRYDIIKESNNKTLKVKIPVKESSWIPTGKYTVKIKMGNEDKIFKNVIIKENSTTEIEV